MEILNVKEKAKELYNLLNSFELCYPIIKRNIEKYEIKSMKNKCFLSWNAGIYFFSKELDITRNIFLDYFFEKIFETFNFKNLQEKGILFAFFSMGAVVSLNNYEEARVLLRDYYKIIAVGIVLIQKLRYDYVENGIKKWTLETIEKYIGDRNSENKSKDIIREFHEIINSKEKEKHESKILN